MDFKSFLFSGG